MSGMIVPPPVASEQLVFEIEKWIADEKTRVAEAVEAALRKFQGVGLATSSVVREEDPKGLLCAEAESRDADCTFVGTTGMGGLSERSSAASPPPLLCARIVRSKWFGDRFRERVLSQASCPVLVTRRYKMSYDTVVLITRRKIAF